MGSFGTGNPFTEDFRLLRGIPAPLGGNAVYATNTPLVVASRVDPWIRAASTDTTTYTAGIYRSGSNIVIDVFLCSGNGSPVPSDVCEIIVPGAVTVADVTVGGGQSVLSDKSLVLATADGAATDPVIRGRSAIIQASTVGRITATFTATAAADRVVIIKYRHIITSATATTVPAVP